MKDQTVKGYFMAWSLGTIFIILSYLYFCVVVFRSALFLILNFVLFYFIYLFIHLSIILFAHETIEYKYF